MAVEKVQKVDARPLGLMLPGMKMAKVWLNEDGGVKMFEAKDPMLRHIWHVELAKDGGVTKAMDVGMGGAIAEKLTVELCDQVKETLKTFDSDAIRQVQDRGNSWPW